MCNVQVAFISSSGRDQLISFYYEVKIFKHGQLHSLCEALWQIPQSFLADFQHCLAKTATGKHGEERFRCLVDPFKDSVSRLDLALRNPSRHPHQEVVNVCLVNVLVPEHESLNRDAATEELGGVGDAVLLLGWLVVLGGLGKNVNQDLDG